MAIDQEIFTALLYLLKDAHAIAKDLKESTLLLNTLPFEGEELNHHVDTLKRRTTELIHKGREFRQKLNELKV